MKYIIKIPEELIEVNTVININVYKKQFSNIMKTKFTYENIMDKLNDYTKKNNANFVKLNTKDCVIIIDNKDKNLYAPSQYLVKKLQLELKHYGVNKEVVLEDSFYLIDKKFVPKTGTVFNIDLFYMEECVNPLNGKVRVYSHNLYDNLFNYSELNGLTFAHVAGNGLCIIMDKTTLKNKRVTIFAKEIDISHIIGSKGSNIDYVKRNLGIDFLSYVEVKEI